MKNSKLKFSEYMQNISWSKRFGKFVLIVFAKFGKEKANCFQLIISLTLSQMHHHNKFRQTTLLFSSLNKPWYFATIVLHTG